MQFIMKREEFFYIHSINIRTVIRMALILKLEWGNVWTFTGGELEDWYQENKGCNRLAFRAGVVICHDREEHDISYIHNECRLGIRDRTQ